MLALPRPTPVEAEAWLRDRGDTRAEETLALFGRSPLLALSESRSGRNTALGAVAASLAEPGSDPLKLAGRWESQLQAGDESALSVENLIDVLQKWLVDLALQKTAERSHYFGPRTDSVRKLAARASTAALLRCYNDVVKMRALASHPLNPRLVLEELAERYLRAFGPPAAIVS